MSFESMDFAYYCDIDDKCTYGSHWAQILLILCKRPSKVYIVQMLIHKTQTSFGANIGCMYSAFDINTTLPRYAGGGVAGHW